MSELSGYQPVNVSGRCQNTSIKKVEKGSQTRKDNKMLSQKFANKIIHESLNGGIKTSTNGLSVRERKALLGYIIREQKCLDTCHLCEKVGA